MKNSGIFIASALIVTVFLIVFAFIHPAFILDCVFALLIFGAFYLIEKKYPLKPWLIILGVIPFILELSALAFNFFAFELYGLGFDKMLHFFNSLIITILLYFWMTTNHKKHKGIKILIAMLVILGFGAFGEILEFLGQRYFHIYNPGMFSQADLLPSTLKNDLTNYDTLWDLIMDFLGSLLAGIILLIKREEE